MEMRNQLEPREYSQIRVVLGHAPASTRPTRSPLHLSERVDCVRLGRVEEQAPSWSEQACRCVTIAWPRLSDTGSETAGGGLTLRGLRGVLAVALRASRA